MARGKGSCLSKSGRAGRGTLMKTPSRRTLTSAASARTAAAQPRRSCNSRRLPRPSASIGQLLELRFEWGTKILPKKSCAGRPSTTGISEPGTRLSSDEDRPTWPPLTTSSGDTVPRVRKQARSRGARYCFQESCPSGEQLSERRDGILTAIRGESGRSQATGQDLIPSLYKQDKK